MRAGRVPGDCTTLTARGQFVKPDAFINRPDKESAEVQFPETVAQAVEQKRKRKNVKRFDVSFCG